MPDLSFDDHARKAMRDDSVSEDEVSLVVGDADAVLERPDGRTEYARMLDGGRWVVVIVEDEPQVVRTV